MKLKGFIGGDHTGVKGDHSSGKGALVLSLLCLKILAAGRGEERARRNEGGQPKSKNNEPRLPGGRGKSERGTKGHFSLQMRKYKSRKRRETNPDHLLQPKEEPFDLHCFLFPNLKTSARSGCLG